MWCYKNMCEPNSMSTGLACLDNKFVMTPREPLTSIRAPFPAVPISRFFISSTCAPTCCSNDKSDVKRNVE